jgi:hypothetical protein
MPDAPDGGNRIGRVWVASTAIATIAVAIGIYLFLSPQQDEFRGRLLRFTRGLGSLAGREDRARKSIAVITGEIDPGNESQKAQAIVLLRHDLTAAELVRVFPHLLRALKDESEMVRTAAATVVGDLGPHFSGEALVNV